jgi:hypothetical protein
VIVAGLREIPSSCSDGRIRADASDGQIQTGLFEKDEIVVLKGVFPGSQLLEIRDTVWEWGRSVAAVPPQTVADTNNHVVEIGISKLQKTFHIYHAYNFNRIFSLPKEMLDQLMAVWAPMRDLQNRISGASAGWDWDATGKKLHPQIIQYPCGGGLFSSHTHALEPQRLGLILAISKRGTDFDTGGAGFEMSDRSAVDTAQSHDLGDLILFKYDLRHWVSFVNITEPLQLDSKRGRWSMVLPYY